MADAEKLWGMISRKKGVVYAALILSEKGLERAIQCRVPHVGIYVSASETHSRKNSNMAVAEAMRAVAADHGKPGLYRHTMIAGGRGWQHGRPG